MIPLVTASAVAFWLLAPLMVLAAVGIVLSRKPVHSVLLTAFAMISLAVQYLSLDSPFLFVVQIIVYTGAIMMLFLFVVMLIGVDSTDSLIETIRGHRLMVALAIIALAVMLILAIGNAVTQPPQGLAEANAAGNVQGIAFLLFNRYVLVFEASAALLLIATIGAMVLAHRERTSPKKTQAQLSRDRLQAYQETGAHPGGLPPSGIFARHDGVDTPALLPDGSVAEASVSRTLKARGVMLKGEHLADPSRQTLAVVDPDSTDTVGGRTITEAAADRAQLEAAADRADTENRSEGAEER